MTNVEADKILSDVERKYINDPGERDRQFRAALEIALQGIDGALEPILKRLAALEHRLPGRPGGVPEKASGMTFKKLQTMSENEQRDFLNKAPSIDLVMVLTGKIAHLEGQIREELQKIRAEIDEIKKGGIKYFGIFQRAQDYQKGSIVTFGGSAWVALLDSPSGGPGESPGWQLLVKSGRDGRDGKDGRNFHDDR
jgi:hypothetical protein